MPGSTELATLIKDLRRLRADLEAHRLGGLASPREYARLAAEFDRLREACVQLGLRPPPPRAP